MKVCKCDRCGKIFEPSFNSDAGDFYSRVIQIGDENFNLCDTVTEIIASYDICEDCYKDFVRWLGRDKIRTGEK